MYVYSGQSHTGRWRTPRRTNEQTNRWMGGYTDRRIDGRITNGSRQIGTSNLNKHHLSLSLSLTSIYVYIDGHIDIHIYVFYNWNCLLMNCRMRLAYAQRACGIRCLRDTSRGVRNVFATPSHYVYLSSAKYHITTTNRRSRNVRTAYSRHTSSVRAACGIHMLLSNENQQTNTKLA